MRWMSIAWDWTDVGKPPLRIQPICKRMCYVPMPIAPGASKCEVDILGVKCFRHQELGASELI